MQNCIYLILAHEVFLDNNFTECGLFSSTRIAYKWNKVFVAKKNDNWYAYEGRCYERGAYKTYYLANVRDCR